MKSQGAPAHRYPNPSLRTAFWEGGGCPIVSGKGIIRGKCPSGQKMTALWSPRPSGASSLTQGKSLCPSSERFSNLLRVTQLE